MNNSETLCSNADVNYMQKPYQGKCRQSICQNCVSAHVSQCVRIRFSICASQYIGPLVNTVISQYALAKISLHVSTSAKVVMRGDPLERVFFFLVFFFSNENSGTTARFQEEGRAREEKGRGRERREERKENEKTRGS